MNIFILGCEGFIGSYLCKHFNVNGYNVWGADIARKENENFYNYIQVFSGNANWIELFSQQKFEYCINAAGKGDVQFSVANPLQDFEVNTLDVARILNAIRISGNMCRYIHISSAAVYGNPKQLPVNETDDPAPLSPYGFHKLLSEIICKEYYQLFNIPMVIIRPFSVYGNGLKKQLFWDICKKLQAAKCISLFGTGNETRDFIHISDLFQAIKKIIDNSPFECNIYNAGTGEETTIRQIADIFQKHFHGQKQISFSGEAKTGDPVNWKADISLITKLGFVPKVNLNDAIVDYITWYCNLVNG